MDFSSKNYATCRAVSLFVIKKHCKGTEIPNTMQSKVLKK